MQHHHATALFLLAMSISSQAQDDNSLELDALKARLVQLIQDHERQRKQIILLQQALEQKEQIARLDRDKSSRKAVQISGETSLGEKPSEKNSADVIYENATQFFGSSSFTFEPSISYSHFDSNQLVLNGFLALDSIFLGEINIDKIRSDLVTLNLAGRYASGDWQFDLNLPYLYRKTNYQTGGAGGASTALVDADVSEAFRLGDVSAGVSYRISQGDKDWPDLVASFRVKAPTGRNPYGIKTEEIIGSSGNLNVPQKLPTGNGVWSSSLGLSMATSVDPAVLYAGINYTFNFTRHFDDISNNPDQLLPARVALGNTLDFYLGTAFAINNKMSFGVGFSSLFSQRSQIRSDGSNDWENIIGSDVNASRLNFNLSYAASNKVTYLYSLGVGLTEDAPDLVLSLRTPLSF